MLCLSLVLNVGYYGISDLLGPVSRFPGIFVTLGVVIGFNLFLVWRKDKPSKVILCATVISVLVYMFVLPIAIEPYYIADFRDGPWHMSRAVYVAETGRSNAYVDPYFDIQPGVFFATGMLILVTQIPPSFLTKWFPLLIVVSAYLPALFLFGRNFFKDRMLALYISLVLIVTWPFRYHYSAQVYCLPILITLTALMMRTLYRERLPPKTLAIIVTLFFPAIVMTHQLVSLATLVILAATWIWLVMSKRKNRHDLPVLTMGLIFVVLWLTYFMWMTVYTFGDFLATLREIISLIVSEGLLVFLGVAIERLSPSYEELIIAKVLFTAIVYVSSGLALAVAWLRKESRSGMVLWCMTALSGLVTLLSLPLGGRSYVERAVLLAGFMVAVGLVQAMPRLPRRRLTSLLTAAFLISLTVAGTTIFNSARNFQFTTYSENVSAIFIGRFESGSVYRVALGLHVADVCPERPIDYGMLAHGRPSYYDAVIFETHCFIERAAFLQPDQLDYPAVGDQNPVLLRVYSNDFAWVYVVAPSS
jgi:hypothetical protein